MKIVIIGYGVMGKAIADKLAAGKFSGSVAVIDRNARKIKSTLIKIGLKAESGS
jgi:pyrroline-5-carboxylate reductase